MTQWIEVKKKRIAYEIAFQLILHGLLFLYHISGTKHSVALHDIVYFLTYALSAWIINYILFPKLYYTKKYVLFLICIFFILNLVIFFEEFVLESLLFPDNKGYIFPGYFSALFEVLPLITLIVGAKFAWDSHVKQKELDSLETAIKSSELQFLKSQINPHFLFNNLNILYSYALEGSSKTKDIILELSSVLRYMLYECEEDFVSLKDEIKQLKSYVALNELQLEERGKVNFDVKLINCSYVIAPLILLVFIENAFKHSMSGLTEGILINISMSISKEGILSFSSSNNFAEQNNTDDLPHGIGLLNVKKRLDLLYTNLYSLTTGIENELYCVKLKLHLGNG